MRKITTSIAGLTAVLLFIILPTAWGEKPPLTLDDFFNSVDIRSVQISPDGRAVVIATARPDWSANRFRSDLWLYREEGSSRSLLPLTRSGHDSAPQWSPDGRWVAFLSDRPAPELGGQTPEPSAVAEKEESEDKAKKEVPQLYVIPTGGGEAYPLTFGKEEVHAFAWSADSCMLYYATRLPWSKEKEEAYRKEWKDVVQFRESERGDEIRIAEVAGGAGCRWSNRVGPWPVWQVAHRVKQLAVSPDGNHLAFVTDSRSQRQESLDPYAIYEVDLPGGTPRVLSHQQAVYDKIAWAADSRHVFFSFTNGSAEGPYQDAQPRVYWVDAAASSPDVLARWAAMFTGAVTDYAVLADGALFAAGRMGTEVQPYTQSDPGAQFARRPGQPGAYERLSAALHSPRVAFVYSSLQHPPEVYVAESPDRLEQGMVITAFNQAFTERELPQGKPYRWTADDGTTIEGMLIYPPAKFEARHLPTFTFIHGGPADADGNHFEADWYQWAALAATQGWLVFEPNYRGSVGYGDAFALGIIPHIVSRPGKDILEGVDALVKDGIADPDRLTVGGYSYGGYMTNWLVTQTTRFKAAVSGAGAVEHVANWGNDDTTFDDAYFLGGPPWQAESNYNAEAALWQIDKVTTPTLIVGGADDIRVYVGEDYLLERALHTRGIPSSLLIFPGEGHELDKNPWHGKIKVREELKWLEKYGGNLRP
jgi:dipeptidyl aminopeptidase/acylaminoacyl peptidase